MIRQHPSPMTRPTFLPSDAATGAKTYGNCRLNGHDVYAVHYSNSTDIRKWCAVCRMEWTAANGWSEPVVANA